jgi:hypothetical protein
MRRGVVAAVRWVAWLAGPCAADDHAWIQRLEAEAGRAEEALAKLDAKEPSRGVVFARVKALHARLVALETAANVEPGTVSGKDELPALTQDLVTITIRIRHLANPDAKKPVDPKALVPRRRAFKHGHTVHAVLDGTRDETVVEVDVPLETSKGLPKLSLTVTYTMPGEKPSVPASVVLALRAVAGGTRFFRDLPVTARVFAEWTRTVPAVALLRLVQRKEVAVPFGAAVVRLPADSLEALRDAASRMGPK